MTLSDIIKLKLFGGGGGGGDQPQLNAPTISLSGNSSGVSEITISNPATNGDFATGYKVYLNGSYHSTVTGTTFTILDIGTFNVTVKATGTDFEDSAESNIVVVANYAITVSTENCTASQSNPTQISNNGATVSMVFTASEGYEVDIGSVAISGASVISVDKTMGTVIIGSATSAVTLTVSATELPTAAILTVAGLGNEDPTTAIFTEEGTTFDWNFEDVTIDGNIFVKIPTLYRKVNTVSDGQITSFSLSDQKVDNDYQPYPCFFDTDGTTILPYVLIGKYCMSSTSVANSVNSTPASQTIANSRANALALGAGYQIYDWQLQKLFIDLALLKSKKVNFQDGNTEITQYLGINNLEKACWIDGVYHNGLSLLVCNDPRKYVTNRDESVIPDGYVALNYYSASNTGEIKKLGYDANNPFINFAAETISNSLMNTYYCDQLFILASFVGPVANYAGARSASRGLWECDADVSWDFSAYMARLCYRPISA